MGKAPAFQFYVKDWLSDPQLKMASHSTKGIWADMLCFMWEAPSRGELSGTEDELIRLVGANPEDMSRFFAEAERLGFCYYVTDHNKIVTLRNRRMYREEKRRKNNAERQQRYRDNHQCDEEVTTPSPITPITPITPPPKSNIVGSKDPMPEVPPSGERSGDGTATDSCPPCPHQEIVDLYHRILPQSPRVVTWPKHLQGILKTRWREVPDRQSIDWWEKFFMYVSRSEFLTGKAKTSFVADMEWLVRPTNFAKILNGRYNRNTSFAKAQPGISKWLEERRQKQCASS